MEENKNIAIKVEQQNNVLFQDVCQIIEQAQESAYRQVNETLIKRNWLLGMRIQHEILQGQRAEYGEQTIQRLAVQLIKKYGDSFSRRNLYHYLDFYKSFPYFFHAMSGKPIEEQIVNTARSQSGDNLKNICQKHIHTEKEDYYIDLVFYNYHLRSFVLIDLKTSKLRHQDVGQMDMYVRMYDEMVRQEGHNPTIGLLLCAETDEDIARYSVLNDNDQLFAAKYLTYMPTQEELRREIEQQKEFFLLQHKED